MSSLSYFPSWKKYTYLNLSLSLLMITAQAHKSWGQETEQETGSEGICPSEVRVGQAIPGTPERLLNLEYWTKRWSEQFDLEASLMTQGEIKAHNQALIQEVDGMRGQIQLQEPLTISKISDQVRGRLEFLTDQFKRGVYVNLDGEPLSEEILEKFTLPMLELTFAKYRVALADIQIKCGPYQSELRKTEGDTTIDRNACTRIKPQALVHVLMDWGNDMWLVRTRLALGWIPKNSLLSPALSPEYLTPYLYGPFGYVDGELNAYELKVPQGVRVPLALPPQARIKPKSQTKKESARREQLLKNSPVLIAHRGGVNEVSRFGQVKSAPNTFNRRDFLSKIFESLNLKYGLGGMREGIDCSRLIVDVFEPFGLSVPRYSGHQATMGTLSVDLTSITSPRRRQALLDVAFEQGITLIYLPGHIMIYLGRDEQNIPRIFHGFADYPRLCSGGQGETTMRVNRVTITDLNRGVGSSKGSYLSRATHIIVMGGGPTPALEGIAQVRSPTPLVIPSRSVCRRVKNRDRIFTSPHQPNMQQPLRLMITRPHADLPGSLKLLTPSGQHISPPLKRLGGPPYVYYTELDQLERGEWRAVFGEGEEWRACTHFRVKAKRHQPDSDPMIWTPKEAWSDHTEALFAGFIERLFQYPLEEDKSWKNLQDLILIEDHNLLFHHLSTHEDKALKLQPDCADLPYTLRAYFAWKMRLPFSYMNCTRGTKKKPPRCFQRRDSRIPREGRSIGKDFEWFARKKIAGHVHSASARTHPQDDETDLYPIALTREALRPGVVFADPYGHLLLIAGWRAQPLGGYGVLIGADGQPDGTIGRRRFWEGSFLFDPDTRLVGAGFKAFRPLVPSELTKKQMKKRKRKRKKKKKKKEREYTNEEHTIDDDPSSYVWNALKNEDLTRETVGMLAYDEQQYRGTRLDFYDIMGTLSSPRPIEIKAHLNALADALFESARRRVLSVQNGEDYVLAHSRRAMRMPKGYSIFETAGPWEDFATPSRDMRLLMAIDTVLDLPNALARTPKRFGLTQAEVTSTQIKVKEILKNALKSRTFEYKKSDGTPQTLSLQSLVERQLLLEMAYNPNDCIEVRWGAPKESEEHKTCHRSAPKRQHRLMKRYRSWFHNRKRPPRGTK